MDRSVGYTQTALILRIARMCQAAGSIVVLYDHVLTFDHEVDHIWNNLFNFGSVNYILIRYVGDALAILNMFAFLATPASKKLCVPLSPFEIRMTLYSCAGYFFVQSWLGVLELILIQLTLQTRLYALYRGSRKILAATVFGYVCEIAAIFTILGSLDADAGITDELLPGLYICAYVRGPSFFQTYVIWLPVIAYDGILCILAIWHGVRRWMSEYRTKGSSGVYITDVLIKDNIGYFVCILLTCVVAIILTQALGLGWKEVSEEYPAPMEVIIGCRLILNLRSSFVQDTGKDRCPIHDDAPWIELRPLSSTC